MRNASLNDISEGYKKVDEKTKDLLKSDHPPKPNTVNELLPVDPFLNSLLSSLQAIHVCKAKKPRRGFQQRLQEHWQQILFQYIESTIARRMNYTSPHLSMLKLRDINSGFPHRESISSWLHGTCWRCFTCSWSLVTTGTFKQIDGIGITPGEITGL